MAGAIETDDDEISGINVTPLVDVVLVLLIIFMITAPALYQSAIKVNLPKAKTGEEAKKSPLNFTVTKDGQLILDKEKIDWATLGPRLATLGPAIADQTAIVSADQATPYSDVVKLMDALRQAGLSRFALNVEATGK